MRAILCGFNGFNQYSAILDTHPGDVSQNLIKEMTETAVGISVEDLSFCWSSVLVNYGSHMSITGFINGKVNSVTLEKPEKSNFIQGAVSRTQCICITDSGKCWKFDLSTGAWSDLTGILLAQSSGHEMDSIIKVSCSDTMVAAVSKLGVAYNIPNVLSTSSIKVTDIACGREHGILLTETGSVFSWGRGSRGQLGSGELLNSEELCEVTYLSGIYVVKISAGGWHNCVLTKDGSLYSWGWNKQGQLGHSRVQESKNGVDVLAEPRFIDWPEEVTSPVELISCGTSHTVAVLCDGTVWGCGWNKWGQLGSSTFSSVSRMTQLNCPKHVKIHKLICSAWNTALLIS